MPERKISTQGSLEREKPDVCYSTRAARQWKNRYVKETVDWMMVLCMRMNSSEPSQYCISKRRQSMKSVTEIKIAHRRTEGQRSKKELGEHVRNMRVSRTDALLYVMAVND